MKGINRSYYAGHLHGKFSPMLPRVIEERGTGKGGGKASFFIVSLYLDVTEEIGECKPVNHVPHFAKPSTLKFH